MRDMTEMMELPLDKIRILPFFKARPPRESTMASKREILRTDGRYGLIVTDRNGWLLDGYATYLLMRENGERSAMVQVDLDPHPVVLAGERGERWDAYAVPMGMVHRLRPGSRVLLYADHKIRAYTVQVLEVYSGRAAWPSRGIILPGRRP